MYAAQDWPGRCKEWLGRAAAPLGGGVGEELQRISQTTRRPSGLLSRRLARRLAKHTYGRVGLMLVEEDVSEPTVSNAFLGQPDSYNTFLIICNVSKMNNVVPLLYSAMVHGFYPVIVGLPGASSTFLASLQPPVPFARFSTLARAQAWFTAREVRIVGIEIMLEARSFLEDFLSARCALMPGNEGTGLSHTQKAVCADFVYIPQAGAGTASLNVHVATTLVMHQYCQWERRQ